MGLLLEKSEMTDVDWLNGPVCTFVDLALKCFHGPTSVSSHQRMNWLPLPATWKG
jgi:hypothetical protein